MDKKFNQLEYIANYDKNHYSKFSAKLKKEEMEELNQLLKKHDLNKTQFVKKAKELLELGYFNMNKNN